jgi:hypothetical protein
MEEETTNKRNGVDILVDDVLVLSSTASPPAPCAAVSVCVAPGTASSLNLSTIRSCPSLSPDSCLATGKTNADSLAIPVNTPPFPSCPSLFRILSSHITVEASSSTGALGFAMLSAIR